MVRDLTTAFANDALDVAEFERRLDIAHRATALAELDALLADLRPAAATPPAPAPLRTSPALAADVPESQTLVALMGGVERRGHWTPARRTQLFALMGGAMLDFREARLGEGVTEVDIFACMGGVEIIVPPGLSVDVGGTAIMGGFSHAAPSPTSPGAPVLRVGGFVLMGGVEVKVRQPGETAKDAHRREREERKRLRKGGA